MKMHLNFKFTTIIPCLIFYCYFGLSQTIKIDALKNHILYLSHDSLQGRGTGTKGEEAAATYISSCFKKIKLSPKGNDNSYYYPFSFRMNKNPHSTDEDTSMKEITAKNVVAFLDNKAQNTIVIGAHYDHLGLGENGSSLEPDSQGKIHNGADDNASGVAGVLELAGYYSTNKIREPYNFLFICFSAEELGLFGSKKYCENPTIDFTKVTCMFNLDMVGRLDSATKKVMIYGFGTSPTFGELIPKIKTNLEIMTDSAGIGPSDQTSFYLKDIPVLHFFTGQHTDYHKPTDDADKINLEGERAVLEYVISLIDSIMKYPKLQFTATRNTTQEKSSRFKVTLGIMPDYMSEVKGVKVDGVSKDKPAFKAGIIKGDIIIQLSAIKIENMKQYMEALSKFNPGDSTDISIMREGKSLELKIKF